MAQRQRKLYLADDVWEDLSRYAGLLVAQGHVKGRSSVSKLVAMIWEEFKERHHIAFESDSEVNGGTRGSQTPD